MVTAFEKALETSTGPTTGVALGDKSVSHRPDGMGHPWATGASWPSTLTLPTRDQLSNRWRTCTPSTPGTESEHTRVCKEATGVWAGAMR